MAKKRVLNSKNPKYLPDSQKNLFSGKKVLICNAAIRTMSGRDTGKTAPVFAVYEK